MLPLSNDATCRVEQSADMFAHSKILADAAQ